MLASIPEEIKPELYQTPKIVYSVNLLQIINQSTTVPGLSLGENKYSRIANITIQFIAIKKVLAQSALDRTFTVINNQVLNDLNPETRASSFNTIDIAQPPTNQPQMGIQIDTDDTGVEEIVNITISIIGVKSEFLLSTLNRVKTYIVESLTTDLNP